jgi:class 3 adenylate cyclase/predicted ATPase
MFCDLVGSTALSQRLDPEDLRRAVLTYQDWASEIIRGFEGHVAQYLGDGLLVYFGYPVAHEDDAERAIRAALAMLADLPTVNERLAQDNPFFRDQRLRVRMGIHTGLVVAGEMGGRDRREPVAVVGETPNIAARVQGEAEPDTVVVSADTRRLVEGRFDFADLGPREMKGVMGPVALFRVIGERASAPRDAELRRVEGPLVGRGQEVELLLSRWEQAREGFGQAVLLSGEAGIGKSRLLRAIRERVGAPTDSALAGRCSPYHQHTPLYPITDVLHRALRFDRADSAAIKMETLESALHQYGVAPDVAPLLAPLLGVEVPSSAAPTLTPAQQREQTLDAIVAILVAMATAHPLLLTVEDLHWVDPTTLELIERVVEQIPNAAMLLVMTARPTFLAPWGPSAHLTTLTLSRFTRRHTTEIATAVAGGKALPDEVLDQIVTKTDGVPLFAEELTKLVLESGFLRDAGDHYELTRSLPPLAIPSTLQDSLMARLDRLAPVKEVAQLAATVGRAFSFELIRAVSDLDDHMLESALGRLVAAEMLYQRGTGPGARYVFKHALIQDTAYQALLRSTRQQYHQRIARVLVETFPETAEEQPELVAHHYTEAGLAEPAVLHWGRAGARAARRSAHREVIGHLTRALDVLSGLPAGVARARWELGLRSQLGPALIAVKGQSSRDVQECYGRARALCQELGDAPQLFPVLVGLRRFYSVRGELATARSVAEQLLGLAQRAGEPALLVEAHHSHGNVLFWMGEPRAARESIEEGIAHGTGASRHSLAQAPYYVTDPVVGSLAYLGWILWVLGQPDQALERSRQAVERAETLEHPHSLAVALDFAIALHEFRGEIAEAEATARAAIRVSETHGFPFWMALARIRLGWALVAAGDAAGGIGEIESGLASHRATGAELARPFLLGLLAEACTTAGRIDDARAALSAAMTAGQATDERFYLAELQRLDGELRVRERPGKRDDAEMLFRQAIDTARSQHARGLELRAATSLARLWLEQGRSADARAALAEITGSFDEGVATRDVQQARQLLASL